METSVCTSFASPFFCLSGWKKLTCFINVKSAHFEYFNALSAFLHENNDKNSFKWTQNMFHLLSISRWINC